MLNWDPRSVRARVLPDIDTAALDEKLLQPGTQFLRLMPAEELLSNGLEAIQLWAVRRARYQFITTELVEWLRARIAGRSVIEVGAGQGDLGHHLGIHMTDSGMQTTPECLLQYASQGQMPTIPPPEVERLDAIDAVKKYKPQVVVASWITQKWHEGDPHGNAYGPEESQIVNAVDTYIHVGNRSVHGLKRILRMKHREYKPKGLVSRGHEQAKNLIYVWG
jgi:hypothetical protein